MAGQIPRNFIDDLLAQTDIVDLVNERVKLKKQGKDYYACCPFHAEKSSSFTVSRLKQMYYCFGCGSHGDAIGFLMAMDNLSFPEAVEELAIVRGLEVPSYQPDRGNRSKRKELYDLMEKATLFYQKELVHPGHSAARSYVAQRGIDEATLQRFAIGFASDRWDALLNSLGRDTSLREVLVEAGLIVVSESNRTYDRFRNRLMFPIRDLKGQVIAFGGRLLGEGQPKYLNSPESPLFHKGSVLYGLYEARQLDPEPRKLLVVEGYMDVVSLAQFGIYYAVASLGTATTKDHLSKLFQATSHLIFCYDGDNAGREAAWRALENAIPLLVDGRKISFLFLPDGEDPDTLIRKIGQESFTDLINGATPLSEFLWGRLLRQVELTSAEGRAHLVSLASTIIKRLPGEALRVVLRNQLIQKVGILDERQLDLLGVTGHAEKLPYRSPKIRTTPMRILISLLLQKPTLAVHAAGLDCVTTLVNLPGWELFNELLDYCSADSAKTTGQILAHWRDKSVLNQLEMLANWDHMIEEGNVDATFIETLQYLYSQLVEQRMEQLIARDRTEGLSREERQECSLLLTNSRKGSEQVGVS